MSILSMFYPDMFSLHSHTLCFNSSTCRPIYVFTGLFDHRKYKITIIK